MIIDIHTHCFPKAIAERTIEVLSGNTHTRCYSDGTAKGLLDRNKKAGIDMAVIVPVATRASQVEKINDVSRIYDGSSGLLSFACIHPDYPDCKRELRRIKAMGYRGVKLHNAFFDVDIDDIRCVRILSECAEQGLIVLAHAGLDLGLPGVVRCSPQMIRRAVLEVGRPVKNGDYQFIAAHMGGWKNWDEVPEALADTGILLDTSTSIGFLERKKGDDTCTDEDLRLLDTRDFMRLFDAFGPERIVFATDSPWNSAEKSLEFMRSLPVSSSDLAMMLGGNALRILGL